MEIAAALAVGNVGLDTLQSLLASIGALCGEMQDAQGACERVYERLTDILSELRRVPRLPSHDKLITYAQLLHRYVVFLERYRAKPLVWRLLKHATMMDELKTLHEEIDTMAVLLQLSTARLLGEWKQQWESDSEAQMRVLLALVDNSASVLHEVRDARAQVEALATLKFELEQRHADQTDQMMGMLKKLYNQIVRVSNAQVPSLPPWFIPSSDVEYYPAPFAQGSFGAVHHARWNSGARVVVKTLLVDNLANQTGTRSAQSRILGEIGVWFQLNHPNVIKMYGACHVSMPPFIVCELAPHGNMADFLDRSPDHQQLMWQLLYEAALGLEYLHKRKVVHGDLKLNNILVGADGTARLADFGLSSVRSTSATSTATASRRAADGEKTEQTAGALRWRAPECLKGKPKFASDVYSLGMCIIEAATGEPPFATVADDIVFQLLRNGEIPDQPDELDDDAWALVTAMTKLQPNERCSLETAIASLKRFALATTRAETKSLFSTSSASSLATTTTVSSSSLSSSYASAVSVARSSVLSGPKGSFPSHETDDFPLPSPESLRVVSPSNNDELDICESTRVPELLVAIHSEAPARRKRALQWIFRSMYDPDVRADLVSFGAVDILRGMSENASVGYYQQLYAWGSVDKLTNGLSMEHAASPRRLPRVRDATTSDRSALLRSLSAAYPDEERVEATEVLTLLSSLHTDARVLADSAPQLVDLLYSRSVLLSASAALALVAFCGERTVDEDVMTMAQRRATPRLVEMLRTGARRQVTAAVLAIGAFAKKSDPTSNCIVADEGGVRPLVTLVSSASGDLRLAAIEALASLSHGCEPVQRAMLEAGVLVPIVEVLTQQEDHGSSLCVPAALVLAYLAKNNRSSQLGIAESGAIGPLVDLVRCGDPSSQAAAAMALANLADGNEANALTMASQGALDVVVGVLRSTEKLELRAAAVAALAHVAAAPANARLLVGLDIDESLVASVLHTTVDPDIKTFASQLLELVARPRSPPPPPRAVFEGAVDARTQITDLLSVVRSTAATGGDRLTTALRWLYRHAYDFSLCPAIQHHDGAHVLLEVALHEGSGYDDRLYALGCLAQLELEAATWQLATAHLREPTFTDLQRLLVAMAPSSTDDARAEATELFACLQCAHASDHSLTEFLPRLLDGLRSLSSPRLVGAAARAITAVARQLPSSGALLADRGALELFVHLVQRGDVFVKEAAAEALGALAATDVVLQYHVMNVGALPALVALVATGESQQKMRAVLALRELLRDNDVVQIMATSAGLVEPLTAMLRSRDETEASYGALGLWSVCQKGGLGAHDVVSRGAVQPLLELLRWATNEPTQLRAAQALHALSAAPTAVAPLRALGVREAMDQLARSATSAELRAMAHQTCQNLA